MSIFANELKNATEQDAELLRAYFRGYDYRGAGYTFISNYIWKSSYCVSWEIIEGYLCLSGARCSEGDENGWSFMAMPMIIAKDSSILADASSEGAEPIRYRSDYEPESLKCAILECKDRFDEAGKPFVFTSIPGHMREILIDAFGDDIEFEHGVDYDEYVYLKEKLITLSGRALHKKKNHLNYFLRNYEYEARPIREVDPEDILALAAKIRDYKAQDEDETEDIENEYEAISQTLEILFTPVDGTAAGGDTAAGTAENAGGVLRPCGSGEGECPIYGVGIYVKGVLEAFAIGEIISDTYAVEHFEKANDDYRGLYQLVCSEFCKQLPESVVYVNREEDMGLPGLRQAKEALKPEYMEERYEAKIRFTTSYC